MSLPEVVFTVDPGTATGYAMGNFETCALMLADEKPKFEFEKIFANLSSAYGEKMLVVCERFDITQRTMKSTREGPMDAIETIGVVRHYARLHCMRELVMQSPDQVKELWTNDRLRKIDWWVKGTEGHAIDGLRHLAYYLTSMRKLQVPV